MQNLIIMAMLLITPGIICLELRVILSGEKHRLAPHYVVQLSISVFVIFGMNLVLKTLLGNGNQLFPLIQPNPTTLSLVKYMASSLGFAILWAYIAEMIVHIIEKSKREQHESK